MRFIHKLGRTNLSQKYIPIVFDTNLKVIIDFADIKRKKMNEAKQFVFLLDGGAEAALHSFIMKSKPIEILH